MQSFVPVSPSKSFSTLSEPLPFAVAVVLFAGATKDAEPAARSAAAVLFAANARPVLKRVPSASKSEISESWKSSEALLTP